MALESAITSSEPIAARFAQLRATSRKALVCYMTAGHPDPQASAELLRAVADAGADVVEVGVPFSDPMADGPVIQESSQIAISHGFGFESALRLIESTRVQVPIVLFSYLNPVLAAGSEALQRAAASGAHGILITDLPVGSDPELESWFADGPLAFVRLVAPTTPVERMREISRNGSGFVYLISRLGVTGEQQELADDLGESVSRLRAATDLPICTGFGISNPEQARAAAALADGVVVGSAIVRKAQREGITAAAELVRSMRAALDAA